MLAEHLSRYTPVPIPYKAPPNYALIATTAGSILTFVVIARFILPALMSRWTWAVFTIGMSLTMVGGYMFVHIRGMPYIAGGQHGGVEYIAPGFQTQYGIEVQIIGFLCAFLIALPLKRLFRSHYPIRWPVVPQFHLYDNAYSPPHLPRTSAIWCVRLDRRVLYTFLRPSLYLQDKKWRWVVFPLTRACRLC
jgi:OST3 / OST6 family, transporter family